MTTLVPHIVEWMSQHSGYRNQPWYFFKLKVWTNINKIFNTNSHLILISHILKMHLTPSGKLTISLGPHYF